MSAGEVPAHCSWTPIGCDLADLQRYGVVVRVLGSDGDAGNVVAGQVVAGGEGLAVIFVVCGAGVAGLVLIADQGNRRVGGVLAVGHGRQDERRQGDEEDGEEPDRRVTESGVRIIGHVV